MASRLPIPHARSRPTLAWILLATVAVQAAADDPAAVLPKAEDLTLGTPVAPASPSKGDLGVGLRSLDVNGSTFAALRSDERILISTAGVERIVEPPENGEAFRAPVVAGDGVPVVVTTRGRIALLEATGTRFLPQPVQRSAKPAAIPNSVDFVLGSENGSIRRLVRSGAQPRLVDVLRPGDAPVGALAASIERVVYARLDGVVLSVAMGGGEPTLLARPQRDVRAIRFVGERPFVTIGGDVIELEGPSAKSKPPCAGESEPADIDSMAATADGRLVALLAAGVIEVRRTADGARVRSSALLARCPSALAWSADGRTLLVATASDARPFAIRVEPGLPFGPASTATASPR